MPKPTGAIIGIIKFLERIFIIDVSIFIGFPTKPISKNFSILELGSINLSGKFIC